MMQDKSLKNGWNNLNEKNPNEQILKNYIWEHIKEITLKGGFEWYNKLANEIEKGDIADLDELQKRMYQK